MNHLFDKFLKNKEGYLDAYEQLNTRAEFIMLNCKTSDEEYAMSALMPCFTEKFSELLKLIFHPETHSYVMGYFGSFRGESASITGPIILAVYMNIFLERIKEFLDYGFFVPAGLDWTKNSSSRLEHIHQYNDLLPPSASQLIYRAGRLRWFDAGFIKTSASIINDTSLRKAKRLPISKLLYSLNKETLDIFIQRAFDTVQIASISQRRVAGVLGGALEAKGYITCYAFEYRNELYLFDIKFDKHVSRTELRATEADEQMALDALKYLIEKWKVTPAIDPTGLIKNLSSVRSA